MFSSEYSFDKSMNSTYSGRNAILYRFNANVTQTKCKLYDNNNKCLAIFEDFITISVKQFGARSDAE